MLILRLEGGRDAIRGMFIASISLDFGILTMSVSSKDLLSLVNTQFLFVSVKRI